MKSWTSRASASGRSSATAWPQSATVSRRAFGRAAASQGRERHEQREQEFVRQVVEIEFGCVEDVTRREADAELPLPDAGFPVPGQLKQTRDVGQGQTGQGDVIAGPEDGVAGAAGHERGKSAVPVWRTTAQEFGQMQQAKHEREGATVGMPVHGGNSEEAAAKAQ